MKLEEIYEILKKADLCDFEEQNESQLILKYKTDKSLSIEKIEKEKTKYTRDSFVNSNGTLKENLSEHEKLIIELCKISPTLNCCGSIYNDTIIVKYKKEILLTIKSLNIYDRSAIDFEIPSKINIYDFEFNIIDLISQSLKAIFYSSTKRILTKRLNIKESNLNDFK